VRTPLRSRGLTWLLLAACLPLPAFALRLGFASTGTGVATALYGLAVAGAAFLLTWASEAAETEVSQALALAVLALVAVLPEYAVDLSFAWTAGHRPEYAAFATANMTGSNRLLVGVGWAAVMGVFWYTQRRSVLRLQRSHALEVAVLLAATLYSFVLPLKGSLAWYDAVVLLGLFALYLRLAARTPGEAVALIGPAALIGALPRPARRAALAGLFLYAAVVIALCAEAFAGGLVETGTALGIDRFLLVQWVAPLASEAPEFIAAVLFTVRGRASAGMGALIASKVNQWTLLIAGLPLAYALSRGGLHALPLDARQVEELLLTAAQSLFAVAVIASLSISLAEAAALLGLFVVQLVLPGREPRLALSGLYLALALLMFWRQRREAAAVVRVLLGRAPAGPADEHAAASGLRD